MKTTITDALDLMSSTLRCRWPTWKHNEAPTHRYCGKTVARAGEPYCPEHRAVAWTRKPARKDPA